MSTRPVITMATGTDTDPITVPGTLADIRATLPDDQRAAFDAEIDNAPIRQIPAIAVRWATPPEIRARIDADADRIRSGDFTGLVNADGAPFEP